MPGYRALNAKIKPINSSVARYFNFNKKSFDITPIETESFKLAREEIKQGQASGNFLVVTGGPGTGKTTFSRTLQADRDIIYVDIKTMDQEQITPMLIQRSIIKELRIGNKDQPISKNTDDNYREISKLLYDTKQNGKIVILLIDDAQQLKAKTLRILKRLREFLYCGKGNLIEIVLLTQPAGSQRISSIEEIARRVVYLELEPFSLAELKAYISQTVHKYFDDDKVLNQWCKMVADRRPLVIQNLFYETLERVMIRSADFIQMVDIESGLSLANAVKDAKIPLKKIGDMSGHSKTAVSQSLKGEYSGLPETEATIQENAVSLLEEDRLSKQTKAAKTG